VLPSDESDVSVGEVDSATFFGPGRAIVGMETSSSLLRLGRGHAWFPLYLDRFLDCSGSTWDTSSPKPNHRPGIVNNTKSATGLAYHRRNASGVWHSHGAGFHALATR